MKKHTRTFTLTCLYSKNGKLIKLKKKIFKASQPSHAARKILSSLCKQQKCEELTVYTDIQETTENSKSKHYTYILERKKRKKPIIRFKGKSNEFKIMYENTVRKANIPFQLKGGGKAADVGKNHHRVTIAKRNLNKTCSATRNLNKSCSATRNIDQKTNHNQKKIICFL